MKYLLLLAVLLASVFLFGMQRASAADQTNSAARLAWWRAARFGMFIHYGPVALTGKELSWSRANSNTNSPNHGETPVEIYDNLYKQFNPTNFNAATWTGLAKSAGMKYMIFVAKHCDGFLMWPSKVDPYNIGASPFHRDFCAELSQAARRDGLGFGFYFSPMDWRDPECRSIKNDHFVAHIQDELRELLTNYGKIDVMWFDSDGRPTMWKPKATYALVRKLQPQIIIDNRLELDTGEEWAHQDKLKLRENQDFYTPEQKVGAYDDRQPWESCITLGTQWSWKPRDKIKSAAEVISILVQTVGGDGNLLLDVGPMPDGRIEPRQVEVLKKVGAWMQVNGESIYDTRGGPWKPTKQIASTRKGNTVYVFVMDRNQRSVELPALPEKILSASLLGGGQVGLETGNGKVVLHLEPRQGWSATVIKLQLDGPATEIPAIDLPETSAASPHQDGYGPTILSVLEYLSRMHGVHLDVVNSQVWWSACDDHDFTYSQRWGENKWTMTSTNGALPAFLNGNKLFTCSTRSRVVTDVDGRVQEIIGITAQKQSITLDAPGMAHDFMVMPDQVITL